MSTKELKDAIQKKLEEVPDSILHEVLDYLKGFQAKTPEEQKRVIGLKPVSYTHLTLPTNREV